MGHGEFVSWDYHAITMPREGESVARASPRDNSLPARAIRGEAGMGGGAWPPHRPAKLSVKLPDG